MKNVFVNIVNFCDINNIDVEKFVDDICKKRIPALGLGSYFFVKETNKKVFDKYYKRTIKWDGV